MSRFLDHLGNNDLLLRARSFIFKKASERDPRLRPDYGYYDVQKSPSYVFLG